MPFADHLVVFRYKDQPGMIGRVGTIFGEHGVNIVSAAVGAEESGDQAVLALTTDAPVPDEVLDEILSWTASRRPGRRPLNESAEPRFAYVRRLGTGLTRQVHRATATRASRPVRYRVASCVRS